MRTQLKADRTEHKNECAAIQKEGEELQARIDNLSKRKAESEQFARRLDAKKLRLVVSAYEESSKLL